MAGFNDIIGNGLIKSQLIKAADTRTVSHAYIFSGEKGIGKRKMAEAFALELMCRNRRPGESACLSCPDCKKVLSGNHPDIAYVIGTKKDSIGVEDVRSQINDEAAVKPFFDGYRIFVVPDADKLTVQAQNALLKTLEEPPEYVVIMLLAKDEKDLLDTVLSRSVKVRLRPLNHEEMLEFLEKYTAGDAAGMSGKLYAAAAFSEGIPGRAAEYMEDSGFGLICGLVGDICRDIMRMDAVEIEEKAAELIEKSASMVETLELFRLYYKDVMLIRGVSRECADSAGQMPSADIFETGLLVFGSEKDALTASARMVTDKGLEAVMEAIDTAEKRLKANVNTQLTVELLLQKMREAGDIH